MQSKGGVGGGGCNLREGWPAVGAEPQQAEQANNFGSSHPLTFINQSITSPMGKKRPLSILQREQAAGKHGMRGQSTKKRKSGQRQETQGNEQRQEQRPKQQQG